MIRVAATEGPSIPLPVAVLMEVVQLDGEVACCASMAFLGEHVGFRRKQDDT